MFHQLIVFACATLVLGAPRVDRNLLLGYPNVGIVGGKDADIKDHPYQVGIYSDGLYLCGGAILDETHVLTTASCTNELPALITHVRAGNSLLGDGGIWVNLTEIYQHRSFDPATNDYDVAVILLAKPLKFSKTIAPIRLAEDELPEGTIVNVTGWGIVVDQGFFNRPSNQLQIVRLPIVNWTRCRSSYDRINKKITDRMMCAGLDKGTKGPCIWDFGDPLVHDNKLYGMFSWSYGCGLVGYPSVNTNIIAVRDFITSHLKQH